MNNESPFLRLVDAHVQAWLSLANSTAAVASLPVRTLQELTGNAPSTAEPKPDPLLLRSQAAEADAAHWQAEAGRVQAIFAQAEMHHRALVGELRRNYGVLEREVALQVEQGLADQKRAIYALLEPLLMQLPVVKRSVSQGLPVEAVDVIYLLAPIDEALSALGFAPIGAVGDEVCFNASIHQVAFGATPEPGTLVTIKNIGYQLDAAILRKARVSTKRQATV
jgi:hypothetical protein